MGRRYNLYKNAKDGWCYLASVLDLHSKKIVGYSFGKNMTNDLVIAALKMLVIFKI